MKLSIIVPVYKCEQYIIECFQSLLTNLTDDVEAIFVDDCSPDRSFKILSDLKNRFPDKNIEIYQNDVNMGSGCTKNNGLSHAKGEYVTFLDSDDFTDDGYYYKMLDIALKNDADVVCSDIVMYEDNIIKDDLNVEINSDDDYILFDTDSILSSWSAASACNKIFKRKVISGYKFKENSKCDDLCFTIPAVACSKKIYYCLNNRYYYRMTKGSLTRAVNIKKYTDSVDCILLTLNILSSINYNAADLFIVTNFIPLVKNSLYGLNTKLKREFLKYLEEIYENNEILFKKHLIDNSYALERDLRCIDNNQIIISYILDNNIMGLMNLR
ncbi:MAG: glycosyltransferase family 2 protein [Bacilli bacterium]|nr:glycosyltransferase family 2 protein [Bacilli bacterium]